MTFANIDGPHNLSGESRLASNEIDDIDWRNAHGLADIHPQARLLHGSTPAFLLFPVRLLRLRLWGHRSGRGFFRSTFDCPRDTRSRFLFSRGFRSRSGLTLRFPRT